MEHWINGTSARRYDENTARPLREPSRLPRQPRRRKPRPRPQAKLRISPLSLVGCATALVLLFLVIFSYVCLYEARSDLAQQEKALQELTQEHERLSAEYESSMDLEAIAQRARQLGMHEPLPSQLRYVQVETADSTTLYGETERENPVARFFGAFGSLFSDLVEYFS